jgi:hypothetical protein
VEGAVEVNVGDRLLDIDYVYLRDGCRRFVLQDEVAGSREGAPLGEDVDGCVYGDDLGLRKTLIFLEVALVLRLDITPSLAVQVFVEDVGIVKVPAAAADGDEQEADTSRNEGARATTGEAQAGGPGVVGTPGRKGNGEHAQEGGDAKPIGDGPEDGRDEMTISIHI